MERRVTSKSAAALWKDYEDYLGEDLDIGNRKHFPSGVTSLHYSLSARGGIPGGTIVQILGENGHGKTTLSYDFIAQAQKSGLRDTKIAGGIYNVLILDFERSYDPDYAEIFGIDTSKVLRIGPPQKKFAEENFDLAEAALLSGMQFILVDSIGALVAKDEEDKSNTDSEKVAAEAKALGRFVKRANAFMENDAVVILINQYRANLNKMGNAPDKKAYGARLVQYMVKLTLELRRVQQEQDRDYIEVFVQKNKLGGKKGIKQEFQIVSTEGIDYNQHILGLALEFGIVEQRKAWFYYPSYADPQYRAQGKDNAKQQLPMDQIKEQVEKFITEMIPEEIEINEEE